MFKKTSTILELPEEVEIKILSNLPVKPLIRFKSVCKRWYSLIGDPFFTSRYEENDDNKAVLCYRKHPTTKTLIASLHDHKKPIENNKYLELPFLSEYDGWEFDGVKSVNLIKRMKKFHKDIQIFGPIKGIYCVFHRIIEIDSGIITLWNPTTRVYKTINPPVTLPFPIHQHLYIYQHLFDDDLDLYDVNELRNLKIGFGYDESINDYKVVVIYHWDMPYCNEGTDCWRVRVYNNATDSWSTICDVDLGTENPSFPFVGFSSELSNCFLNGIYHWSVYRPADEGYPFYSLATDVLAFELASETFKVIRGPPIYKKWNENYCSIDSSVWVLKNTIAVVAIFRTRKKTKKVEVWLMSEYGVEDSWDMLCSIAIQPLADEIRVVGIPNDEQIYFVDRNRELISYRFDDYKVTRHSIFDGNLADGRHSKSWLKHHGTLGVLNYVETLETVETKLGNSSTNDGCKLRPGNSNNDFYDGRDEHRQRRRHSRRS